MEQVLFNRTNLRDKREAVNLGDRFGPLFIGDLALANHRGKQIGKVGHILCAHILDIGDSQKFLIEKGLDNL